MYCITKFSSVRDKQQQRAAPRLCSNCSLWFQSREQGTRVKDRATVAKTVNPVRWSFFAQEPNGNACYAGEAPHHVIGQQSV